MASPIYKFDRDPSNRDQMNYKDHIEKAVAQGKVDPNWKDRISFTRDRTIEGAGLTKISLQ